VSVNYIHGDFEYDLKRELQDKMVENIAEAWSRGRAEETNECPYYKEDFDFGELDDRMDSSLTGLIHERLDEYFDNDDTFDLSEWVNERIGATHDGDYADLNQYEFNSGTLCEWLSEALEYHGDADEIYQHFCDENLDGEIWSACLHEILEWIDKTYKPKTIDELTEENKTLKEEIETLKKKNDTLSDARRLLVEEIETLKEKNYTIRRLLESRQEAIESWREVEKTLKKTNDTLRRRLEVKEEIETLKKKNETLKEENKTLKE
jgi:cell division protein FtsB